MRREPIFERKFRLAAAFAVVAMLFSSGHALAKPAPKKSASRAPASSSSSTSTKKPVKSKVVYRTHTQLDFSGETVQGQVRAPEVFYIFQRKRSEARHVVRTPASFDYHHGQTVDRLRKVLPQ